MHRHFAGFRVSSPAHRSFQFCLVGLVMVVVCSSRTSAEEARQGIRSERGDASFAVRVDEGYMVPYRETMPGSDVAFWMIPVPGGEFSFPAGDSQANASSRLVNVRVEPFWIGKTEVTWGEYAEFMDLFMTFRSQRVRGIGERQELGMFDAITAPTQIYEPRHRMLYATGADIPATSMTQFAARQYTRFLSELTGRSYRLPCEAEWVHACWAGRSPENRGDAAKNWTDEAVSERLWLQEDEGVDTQQKEGPARVASKSPNPWGIFDMTGNVAEWVLDAGEEPLSRRLSPGQHLALSTIGRVPESKYGHLACGGTWYHRASECHVWARIVADRSLWDSDPDLPHSPSWIAAWDERDFAIGFRVLRSYRKPEPAELRIAWGPDSDALTSDLRDHLESGRGVLGSLNAGRAPLTRKRLGMNRPWLSDK